MGLLGNKKWLEDNGLLNDYYQSFETKEKEINKLIIARTRCFIDEFLISFKMILNGTIIYEREASIDDCEDEMEAFIKGYEEAVIHFLNKEVLIQEIEVFQNNEPYEESIIEEETFYWN